VAGFFILRSDMALPIIIYLFMSVVVASLFGRMASI
jgi:hypothetical protein